MSPLLKSCPIQGSGADAGASLPSEDFDRSHILLALTRLGDYSRDAFLATDTRGAIVYMNRSAEHLFGYSEGAAIGLAVEALMPGVADIDLRLLRADKQNTLPWRGQGLTRQRQSLRLAGAVTNIPASTGHSHLYVIRESCTDPPDLDRQTELASLVYRSTSEGMVVLDAKGHILGVNPAFVKLRGQSAAEVIGSHVRCLNSPCHDQAFYRTMWRSVTETGSWQGEHWGQHGNGELYPQWLSINTSYNADGLVHRRVMILSNIAEIKQAEAIIWKQANFDRLTDLPNRQMFYDRLGQSLRKSRRTGERTGLLYLDLDRFKEINDTLGHAMGDDLLRETARRLSSCTRPGDIVARLGGDEFTVLLDDVRELRDIEYLIREILRRLAEPFLLGAETVSISTSIGVALYPDDAQDADVLLNNADQAMYAAKSEGRNRSCFFTRSMQAQVRNRIRLIKDLHQALDQNQFSLDFQPIVDLASDRIVKVETLLRWHHPSRGLISPEAFIPLAEETGLICSIGDWVFCTATRQVAEWCRRYGLDMQVSINFSPAQLRNEAPDFASWRHHLDALGLSPRQVIIEITEGLLIDSDDERVQRQLGAFRRSGMQVALDDFGTGYSSLSYLRKFDIDLLKIDQSFVAHLESDGPDLALCEAVILLAHKLGLCVVAEGIESRRQYELLTNSGCDYGQGYLFSRPLPAADLERLLASGADLRPVDAR